MATENSGSQEQRLTLELNNSTFKRFAYYNKYSAYNKSDDSISEKLFKIILYWLDQSQLIDPTSKYAIFQYIPADLPQLILKYSISDKLLIFHPFYLPHLWGCVQFYNNY